VGLGTALTQGPCPSLHYDALPRPPGPVGSDSGGPGEGAAGDGEDAELWCHALRTPGPDPRVVLQALDALTVLYTRSSEVDYVATLVAVCSALVQWRGHPGVQAEGLGLMAKLISWHPADDRSLEPAHVDSDGVEDAASSGSPGWQGPHCEPQDPPGSAAHLLHVTVVPLVTLAVTCHSDPGQGPQPPSVVLWLMSMLMLGWPPHPHPMHLVAAAAHPVHWRHHWHEAQRLGPSTRNWVCTCWVGLGLAARCVGGEGGPCWLGWGLPTPK